MSATYELRRMLDERGVEYMEDHGYHEFFWEFGESGVARASAIGTKGLVQMIVTGITPEQAIDATLGRGTCRAIRFDNLNETNGMGDAWEACSECGALLAVITDNQPTPNYCPNCGRKVVED